MNEHLLVWEPIDPRDTSIAWLRSQGVVVHSPRAADESVSARYPEDRLIADAAGCAAFVGSGGAKITAAVINAVPSLRVISKIGIGIDNIDVAAATAHGVVVCHTPDENDAATVAEHAIALMLALVKRLPEWPASHVRSGG